MSSNQIDRTPDTEQIQIIRVRTVSRRRYVAMMIRSFAAYLGDAALTVTVATAGLLVWTGAGPIPRGSVLNLAIAAGAVAAIVGLGLGIVQGIERYMSYRQYRAAVRRAKQSAGGSDKRQSDGR